MPVYAQIAIPNLPKDTLTYAVPEGLAGMIQPGQRAVVPLGRRPVMGFVTALNDEAPGFAVKELHEIMDPRPVISENLRRLCAWISRYYCCPLGDALKAALPQGMGVDSERFAHLATGDTARIAAAVGASKTKALIVEALRTGEVMAETALADMVGLKSVSVQLRSLELDGIVAVESVLERSRVRARLVKVVRLLPPWNRSEKIRELMDLMEARAPKQVNVLAVLWRNCEQGRPTVPMSELAQAARAGSAQIRALAEKEIVEVLEEEAPRLYKSAYEEIPKSFALTEDQLRALETVNADTDGGGFKAFLLHGVTAGGKTQVYIEAIRRVLQADKRALVLVPEISLTPQLVFRFRHAFGKDVNVLHSRMSLGERYDSWRMTLDGRVRVVVGVRSAVFAPLEKLGLIVVDEEHESSYKQSDAAPRYNARDAAVMRASIEGATVLLGSATPSAESRHNVILGKYALLSMPNRIDGATLPSISPIDMTERRKSGKVHASFSTDLIEGVRGRIKAGEASIILHNRRGYAPHVECRDCGHVEECDNCSISLVYHKDRDRLRCHYCGAMRKAPAVCPRCGGVEMETVGAGTQRVEEELREMLPEARILRMDFDTTRKKGTHDLILTSFGEGEADVLLGTQMVAKGLDFDRVTLVGVIAAEQSLMLPDFRAGERAFQLLTQVSGRSGRGSNRGEVMIQTRRPDHPVLQRVCAHDYEGFMEAEMESRRSYNYPPFSRLVLLLFSASNEGKAAAAAAAWHNELRRHATFFTCYPPQPALIHKINNRYRQHLLLRVDKNADPDGARLAALLRATSEQIIRTKKQSASVRVDIDVDPQSMI